MENKITNHPALMHAQDMMDICKPLLQLNISYFCHVHVSKDNKFSGISNNPAFSEHYLKNRYYNADIHMAQSNHFGDFVLWDEITRTGKSEKMHQEAMQLGVKHAFTIINKHDNGADYYHFANNEISNSINQSYLANWDLLNLFIQYFSEIVSGHSKLKKAYDVKFSLDTSKGNYEIFSEALEHFTQENRLKFQTLLKEKSLIRHQFRPLSTPSHNIFPLLTERERRCLHWLLIGKTAPQIAMILNVSVRTIEKYLANLKSKFNCQTLCELGYRMSMIQVDHK